MMKSAAMIAVMVALACAVTARAQAPCDCRPSGSWTFFDTSKPVLQFQGCSKIPGEININPNDAVCSVSDACTTAWHPEWFDRNGGSATARFKFCIPSNSPSPAVVPSPSPRPSPSPSPSPRPSPSPSPRTPSPSPSSPTNLGPCDCRPSGTWTYYDSSKANLQFQGCSKVPGEVNVNPNDGVCQVSDACTSAWHPEWFARNGGSAMARFKFCIPGATQTPSPSPARSPSPAVCQDQLPPNMCNCQGNPILCQKTCGLCGTANPSPSPSPQRSPSPAVCVDRVTPLECNCKSNPSTCPLSCALCGGGVPDCKDLIDNCRAAMCTGSPLQRAACAVTCGLCVPVSPGASPRPSPSPSPRPSPSPSPSGPSGPSGTCLRLPATAAINVSNIICNAVNGNALTSAAFVKAVTDIMAATWTASNPTLPVPSSSVTGTLTASCGKPSGNQLIVNVNMNFQGAAATLATVLAGARNFNAGGFINNQQFRTAYGVTFSRVDFAVPVTVGDCRSVTTPGTSPAPGNLRIVVPLTWTLSIPSIICGQLPEDSNFRNDFNDVMFQGWDDVSSSSISEKDIVYTDSSFDVSGCDKSQLIVKVNLNLPAGITQSQSFALVQSFLRAAGARIMGQSLVDAYGISSYSAQTGLFGR